MHVRPEHNWGRSRALDEGVAIASGNACRREREIIGERPDDEVVVMDGNQRLVVGNGLVQPGAIIQDIQLHLVAKNATTLVNVLGPELIPLLCGLAVGRKVSR